MLSINRELAWMAPIDGFAFRVVKPYRLGTVVGSLPSGCLPIDGASKGGEGDDRIVEPESQRHLRYGTSCSANKHNKHFFRHSKV